MSFQKVNLATGKQLTSSLFTSSSSEGGEESERGQTAVLRAHTRAADSVLVLAGRQVRGVCILGSLISYVMGPMASTHLTCHKGPDTDGKCPGMRYLLST